jgi:endonuclease/exonuclease/phosphatase family metal-dependent hydrolase
VPAFQFLDRERAEVVRMFDAAPASRVAAELQEQNPPLLTGGCSYSNIYAGGAAEARFCAETLEEEPRRILSRPWQVLAVAILYLFIILRVAALAGLELVIALADMVRGVVAREDWRAELHYVWSRVLVSIVLREYVRAMVKLAIEEGAPVVYANFLGYDEQAHRRGPGSVVAHWGLKGIDGAIGDIFGAARRAPGRNYEVIVFSDHGQECARIFDRVRGCTLEAAIEKALADGPLAGRPVRPIFAPPSRGAELDQRARRLMHVRRGLVEAPRLSKDDLARDVVVTALGPLGHVYSPALLDDAAKRRYAQRLVHGDSVPTVLYRDSAECVWACNRRGLWRLPNDAAEILGQKHPFLQEAAEDLAAVCRHRNAGDLVVTGWDPGQKPMTFVQENGAHGSVGVDETRAFALIPDAVAIDARRAANGESYVRGEDLYRAARAFLLGERVIDASASVKDIGSKRAAVIAQARTSFRVMTYNVHSCVGLDGRMRPERILQVIRSTGADIIALQEVDANRLRSARIDQARFLAERLSMSHHYFAVLEDRGEQYGLAIISRFPLRHIQSAHLTPADSRRRCEARGALWVEIDAPAEPVQLINTHFGLTREERLRQAAGLAGEQWLGKMANEAPIILCGDLNAPAGSPPCRLLCERLIDVQRVAASRPRGTFPSILSVRRIDHIFVSPRLEVQAVVLPRTPTAIMASDHLPVAVDLNVLPASSRSKMDERRPRGAARPAAAASIQVRGK